MYEITVHTEKADADKAMDKIQKVLKMFNNERRILNSFEGEMSSYIYIETNNKEEAEKIIQELKKIKEIDNVYLKSKGTPPS